MRFDFPASRRLLLLTHVAAAILLHTSDLDVLALVGADERRLMFLGPPLAMVSVSPISLVIFSLGTVVGVWAIGVRWGAVGRRRNLVRGLLVVTNWLLWGIVASMPFF